MTELTSDRLARDYGVNEDNPIDCAAYDHTAVDYSDYVPLTDPRLASVDRLRLLTEPGYPYYDISYVWGTLRDGRHVRINTDRMHLERARPGKSLKAIIVEWAKEEGFNAKRLGMLTDSVVSILR